MAKPTNLIRLSPPLSLSDLPAHDALPPSSQPSRTSSALALDILTQAQTLVTSGIESLSPKGSKKSSGSATLVQVSNGMIDSEYWVARKSRHAGKKQAGDADWQEFDGGLRVAHSKHEMEYTPSVTDYVPICNWDIGSVEGWSNVNLAVVEMLHSLPAPLNQRAFTILVASGILGSSSREFTTATVPLAPLPKEVVASKYGNAPKVVHGAYVSVERVHQDGDEIVWVMATASDAKGALPMTIQKLGITGAIVKDVGLFLGWVDKQRLSAVK